MKLPSYQVHFLTYRYYIAGVVGGILALLSCAMEPCACPPSRTHVVVTGNVTRESNGVADAQVRFQEQPHARCPAVDSSLIDLDVYYDQPHGPGTDASGTFTAHPYSVFGPGERCLVVTVAAGGDAVAVGLNALFRDEHERPETVHVDIVLDAP